MLCQVVKWTRALMITVLRIVSVLVLSVIRNTLRLFRNVAGGIKRGRADCVVRNGVWAGVSMGHVVGARRPAGFKRDVV